MIKTVGNKLKALRKQKRLTQKELAATIGIGISQLNKYESGMHMPPIKKLIQLSNIFDTTLDSLVKGRQTQQNCTTVNSSNGSGKSNILMLKNRIPFLKYWMP